MSVSSTRLVFIYVGKYDSTNSYTLFNSSNLNSLSNASGFVIKITDKYSIYGNGSYTALINVIKTQVQTIVSCDKPFYIAIPVVNAPANYTSTQRTTDYQIRKQYVLDIKTMLQTVTGAWALFKGFYWSNERIFGTVSPSSPLSNQHVKLINDLAYVIQSDPVSAIQKEFIWAPYLGFNSAYYSINENIGAVANKTSLFNTIFLQSHYYFTPQTGVYDPVTGNGTPAQNLALAHDCAQNNVVYNYSSSSSLTGRVIVGGSKTGNTTIGLVLEGEDSLKWNSSTYAPYYQAQVSSYGPLFNAGTCPFVAYGGSYNGIITAGLYKTINRFYLNGTYLAP